MTLIAINWMETGPNQDLNWINTGFRLEKKLKEQMTQKEQKNNSNRRIIRGRITQLVPKKLKFVGLIGARGGRSGLGRG